MLSREAPFESEQHPLSRRWAVVEDDGEVAWLYLSAPESPEPIAACFLYNSSSAPVDGTSGSIHFRWSVDGDGVTALIGELPLGFIADAKGPGISRLLKVEGSFGNPLDIALFGRTFRAT